jgi:hypothetical protein
LSGSFETQRAQSFYSFFLSADPGGIGSAPEKHTSCFTGQAFHRAEEGRKEKTTSLREGLETVHDTGSVLIQVIFCHGVADSFHLPASQRQMEKDRSLCVLGVLSEAGGNSLKLKLTIYDVIYFMHSVVITLLLQGNLWA